MTLALDTVEDREILSVDALSLVLNKDAARRARDLPLREGSAAGAGGAGPVGVVGDPGSEPAVVRSVEERGVLDAAAATAAALTLLALARAFLRELSLPSSASADSSRVDAALKESARRRRPLSPPRDALDGATGSPSCESSLLMLRRLAGVVLWRGVGGDAGRMVPELVGRYAAWLRGLGFTGRRTSWEGGAEGLDPLRLRAEEDEVRDDEDPAASVRAYGGCGSAGCAGVGRGVRRDGGAYGWKTCESGAGR